MVTGICRAVSATRTLQLLQHLALSVLFVQTFYKKATRNWHVRPFTIKDICSGKGKGRFLAASCEKVFLCRSVAHFVPSCGTFCAVLWHILCRPVAHFVPSCGTFVPSCGTFCAVLWHILCRPVAHKSFKVFLCRAIAIFVPSRDT
jgi:hypothetical protein